MKFLSSLIERYRQLDVVPPQWINEYTTGTPGPMISTAGTTATASTQPTIKTDIENLLKVQKDPELEKRKKELDDLYKQVADALKKKAQETANALKQTAANVSKPSTPAASTPTTPSVPTV